MAPRLNPTAVAAQQAWNAMPWYQKGLVSYGKGASDIVRGDAVQPAMWAAEKLGLAKHGAAHKYAEQTHELNRHFDTLQSFGPRLGAAMGRAATLIPAAMATDNAASALIPENAGLMGALGSSALTGGAVGALASPEARIPGAITGAIAGPAFGLLGRAAKSAAFPLLRALHSHHMLSAGQLYNLLIGGPTMAGEIGGNVPKLGRNVSKPFGGAARDAFEEAMTERPEGAR